MSSGITSKDLHKPLSERVARNLSDRKYSDSSKNIYGIEDNSYTHDGDAPDATIIDTLLPLNINDQSTLDGSDAAEYVPLDGDKIKGSHDNILSRLQDVDEVKRKIRVRKRKGSKFVEMTDTSGKDENNFHKLECGEHTVTKMGDQSLSSERHLSCDQVNKVELNVFRIPYNESDKTHLSVGNEVSTQEEANGPEKLCIDDIHLPFEEDVQTPTNHDSSLTCKQNTGVAEHPLHIEDLHLPFDEVDDELRNSVSKAQTALGLLKLGNASADSSMNDTSMSDVNLEAVKMKRKSVGRRRSRRSADFEIINENVVEISPDVALPDVSSARRSKRLKRKSIEIYRSQHKKKIQPESPDSNDSMNTSSEDAAGQKDRDEKISLNFENEHIENENKDKGSTDITLSEHCVNMETIVEDQGGTQFVSVAVSHDEPCHDKPLEKTSEELSELSRTPRKRKCALKPKDNLDKPVRKGKKRKVGPSIEDIYLNKLWKSQMPMEHPWETIYEEPKVLGKGGREEYQSHKRMKRALIPEEFYTQTKLKKRRQKAIKHGWKPLSKKRLDKAGQLLEEKLSALDKDIITMDSNCDKDETVASCKNDTKDDGETCTGNVSISTFGMGQSFEHSHIKTGENNDVVVKEYEVFNCQKFDTSSSQSSRNFLDRTPRPVNSEGKKNSKIYSIPVDKKYVGAQYYHPFVKKHECNQIFYICDTDINTCMSLYPISSSTVTSSKFESDKCNNVKSHISSELCISDSLESTKNDFIKQSALHWKDHSCLITSNRPDYSKPFCTTVDNSTSCNLGIASMEKCVNLSNENSVKQPYISYLPTTILSSIQDQLDSLQQKDKSICRKIKNDCTKLRSRSLSPVKHLLDPSHYSQSKNASSIIYNLDGTRNDCSDTKYFSDEHRKRSPWSCTPYFTAPSCPNKSGQLVSGSGPILNILNEAHNKSTHTVDETSLNNCEIVSETEDEQSFNAVIDVPLPFSTDNYMTTTLKKQCVYNTDKNEDSPVIPVLNIGTKTTIYNPPFICSDPTTCDEDLDHVQNSLEFSSFESPVNGTDGKNFIRMSVENALSILQTSPASDCQDISSNEIVNKGNCKENNFKLKPLYTSSPMINNFARLRTTQHRTENSPLVELHSPSSLNILNKVSWISKDSNDNCNPDSDDRTSESISISKNSLLYSESWNRSKSVNNETVFQMRVECASDGHSSNLLQSPQNLESEDENIHSIIQLSQECKVILNGKISSKRKSEFDKVKEFQSDHEFHIYPDVEKSNTMASIIQLESDREEQSSDDEIVFGKSYLDALRLDHIPFISEEYHKESRLRRDVQLSNYYTYESNLIQPSEKLQDPKNQKKVHWNDTNILYSS